MSSWSASLRQIWGISTLPDITCEEKSDHTGRYGRVQFQDKNLPDTPWISLVRPLKLNVHREAKPWGYEVWYTGIESRGVCSVEYASGRTLQLPAYLELSAGGRNQRPKKPVALPLLKILAPKPQMDSGCLYIEVHQEKWETYFVSHVDKSAWPDGSGKVLFGFSASKMAEFDQNEAKFKKSLLDCVHAYQRVRNQLDSVEPSAAPDDLSAQEAELWSVVRSYFEFIDVRVGDVIRVPPFVPHSLQNGVQVVEFQTPTYERLILAFNQKVVTQNHWDTQKALDVARFNSGEKLHRELCGGQTENLKSWSVAVDFPGFQVLSIETLRGQPLTLPASSSSFSVLFVLTGAVEFLDSQGLSVLNVRTGEAVLIPVESSAAGISLNATLSRTKLLLV